MAKKECTTVMPQNLTYLYKYYVVWQHKQWDGVTRCRDY